MKFFTCLFVAALCLSPLAQAQVTFNSGSAQPNNPEAAKRDLNRRPVVAPRSRAKRNLVRCRDGSRHTARVCRRHGGFAR